MNQEIIREGAEEKETVALSSAPACHLLTCSNLFGQKRESVSSFYYFTLKVKHGGIMLLKSLQVANHEVKNKITAFLVSTPFDLFTLVLLLYASVQITSIKIKFMRLLLSVGVEGWAASHACPYYIVLMSV